MNETKGMERLMKTYQAIEEIVLTLRTLESDQRLRVFRLVRDELRAGGDLPVRRQRPPHAMTRSTPPDRTEPATPSPVRSQHRGAPRYMPRANGPAVIGTYELAMKHGEITNTDVGARWGLTKSGADQRIQAALKSEALVRIRHGVYGPNRSWRGAPTQPMPAAHPPTNGAP